MMESLIDAFLAGDTLFRFVYKPATQELFLEEELEEADNGQFVYVPYKDARDLYMEMTYFADRQGESIEAALYKALSSPSPISKFEKLVEELALASAWQQAKRAFARKYIEVWLRENGAVQKGGC